ncbi:hypothetical protein R1flu_016717 [Riccia fluitans]|uniref:Uncharacterized protein n=1 Tax=Riccia fluitans TaxID=41844 RepID=A0ABD1YN56_9MARC
MQWMDVPKHPRLQPLMKVKQERLGKGDTARKPMHGLSMIEEWSISKQLSKCAISLGETHKKDLLFSLPINYGLSPPILLGIMSDSVRKEKFPFVLPSRFFPYIEGKVKKPDFNLASDVEEKSKSEEEEYSDDALFKH